MLTSIILPSQRMAGRKLCRKRCAQRIQVGISTRHRSRVSRKVITFFLYFQLHVHGRGRRGKGAAKDSRCTSSSQSRFQRICTERRPRECTSQRFFSSSGVFLRPSQMSVRYNLRITCEFLVCDMGADLRRIKRLFARRQRSTEIYLLFST